jgi:hypothetical protein
MILTGENGSTRSKACSSATVSTNNPIWACPAPNHALRSEGPATNRLPWHGPSLWHQPPETWHGFEQLVQIHSPPDRQTDNPDAITNTNRSVLLNALCGQNTEFIFIIIGIQPLGRFGQRPELSQATGIALVCCILGKFLGVVCHCFPQYRVIPVKTCGTYNYQCTCKS